MKIYGGVEVKSHAVLSSVEILEEVQELVWIMSRRP
jgi:hypothetical protein